MESNDCLRPALSESAQRPSADAKVGLAVDNGRLVVEPKVRPRYALDELLAQCDPAAVAAPEDREWLDGGPVGGELL